MAGLDLTPPLPPIPLLSHSHLQVGAKASLLSHAKTLELYRANAKKANDPEITFEFAALMISVAKDLGEAGDEEEALPSTASSDFLDIKDRRRSSFNIPRKKGSPSSSSSSIFRATSHTDLPDAQNVPSASSSETDLPMTKRNNLLREAAALLRKLANQGHVPAQYMLGDLYSQGALSAKGKREYDRAFPLFVLAAKHGHTDAAFRTAQCCEHALGCRKDTAKAFHWYKCASVSAKRCFADARRTEKHVPTPIQKLCFDLEWPKSRAS
jgi:TPR repeat protein